MAIASLKNKQVLITGAGAGIGRAAALAFAREGANIVATDLRLEPLESLRREVQALGVQCRIHAVDVGDEAAMKALADTVHQSVGPLDVLVNNAGIGYLGLFLEGDLANWRPMLQINVMGVVHGCRYFLPAMVAAGGPRRVLNVSSSAGNYPAPSMASYAASKYAVVGFSEVLKMELADTGVGVTTVCPGIVNTAIVGPGAGLSPSVPETQIARLRAHYKADGASPDVVAGDMVRAVLKGKDMCLTGPGSALVYHVKRISQSLLRRVMVVKARRIGYLPD